MFSVLIFSAFLFTFASCTNVLIVAPLASPSHYLWNKGLAMVLVERGYNVTILTPETDTKVVENYTVITMEGLYELARDAFDFTKAMNDATVYVIVNLYVHYMPKVCAFSLKTQGLRTLIHYPTDFKFDLIIFDVTMGQCLYPLLDRFNAPPVVAVTAFMLPPYLSHSFGNHLYSSYMPHYNTVATDKMGLMQRLLNFIYIYLELFYREYWCASAEYALQKTFFGENIRRPEEVERSISILLVNTDPILDYPIALPPNIIPIGGLHVKPSTTLPQDLEKIMNEAKHGVILFSLGTNIMFSMLSVQQRKALIGGLRKFPQIILWKIEMDNVTDIPENVIVKKWLPQNEILAHPNLRLFISHGGALSTQEAMYHGIPLVCIPFIIDQYLNTEKLVKRKVARFINHGNLSADGIYEAVSDVLNNPSYSENMKLISKRYRDQPQTPLERGLFWIEYVLRHGSAEHLVTPARDMPFWKTSNLDVLCVALTAVLLIYKVVKFIFSKIFAGSNNSLVKVKIS